MSSNFGQIPPPTPELCALARLKNCCEHSSAYIFEWIFFIFSGNEDTQQVWTEFEFWPDGTKGCRVIALDRCQKLVFAQYLENGWSEFYQILDTLYYWHYYYLCCYSKASFFTNLQRSYSPWLISEIGILLNILRKDGQNSTKFCIHIIIDKIYISIIKRLFSQMFNRVAALNWCQKLVFAQYLENGWTEFNQILYTLYHWQDLCLYRKGSFFCKFATELQPLIYVRNCFLLNILRMDGQNLTKFCIHIIIDKIYAGKVKHHFSQICNRVMALDWCQKLFFAQYLDNECTEFNQILYIHYHWHDLSTTSSSNRDCAPEHIFVLW